MNERKKLLLFEVKMVVLVLFVFLIVFSIEGGWKSVGAERYFLAAIAAGASAFSAAGASVIVSAAGVTCVTGTAGVVIVAGIVGTTLLVSNKDLFTKVSLIGESLLIVVILLTTTYWPVIGPIIFT